MFDAPLYLDRCLKYTDRGFAWMAPIGYDHILAQKPLIAEKKTIDYAFNNFYYNVDYFRIQDRFLGLNMFE